MLGPNLLIYSYCSWILAPWVACESSPCDNGATCVDVNVDTFICVCRDGFFGVTCSESNCFWLFIISKFVLKVRWFFGFLPKSIFKTPFSVYWHVFSFTCYLFHFSKKKVKNNWKIFVAYVILLKRLCWCDFLGNNCWRHHISSSKPDLIQWIKNKPRWSLWQREWYLHSPTRWHLWVLVYGYPDVDFIVHLYVDDFEVASIKGSDYGSETGNVHAVSQVFFRLFTFLK